MQNNNQYYILYGTSACHLCDDAEDIITSLPKALKFQKIDIAEDEKLSLAYGIRIPVLKSIETQQEIAWPFNLADLQNFLRSN